MNDEATGALPHVGFVGLGDQGEYMAEHIVTKGFPLTIFARREEIRARFAGLGAAVAPTLRELGAASEIVGICVVDDEQVREVVLGDDGILAGMAPGGILAVHSTVHPETCRELGRIAAERGVTVVDAPVTGSGRRGAQDATLTVPVGGTAVDFERCRPVFECFASTVQHMGALGAGQITKLINNYMYAVMVSIAYDEATLVRKLGIDLSGAAEVLPRGSAWTMAFAGYAARGFDHVNPPHQKGRDVAWRILAKDVRIMREVLAAAGVEIPEAEANVSRSMRLLEETRGELG